MRKTEAGERVWELLQNVDKKSKNEFGNNNIDAKNKLNSKKRNEMDIEELITANKITDDVLLFIFNRREILKYYFLKRNSIKSARRFLIQKVLRFLKVLTS